MCQRDTSPSFALVCASKNVTLAQADYHRKRIDRANKRHLSSVHALAHIRKMWKTLQINIAEKQINTATG